MWMLLGSLHVISTGSAAPSHEGKVVKIGQQGHAVLQGDVRVRHAAAIRSQSRKPRRLTRESEMLAHQTLGQLRSTVTVMFKRPTKLVRQLYKHVLY